MAKKTIRYSEQFKLQVIKDIESGRFPTIAAARRHFGIQGIGTISDWLRKYGKNHLLGKVVIVQKPDELDEKKRLKKRIKELEQALVQTQVQSVIHESYFEIVCEENGIKDIEAYKKKLNSKLQTRHS